MFASHQAMAQNEESLSFSVKSMLRKHVSTHNQPRLLFASEAKKSAWLTAMRKKIAPFVTDPWLQTRILTTVHYEAHRAGLDPQLILALIQVESRFRLYAISNVGARGMMQVMPFWVDHIGENSHNLFDLQTNLRYGCTILRHYLNREQGDLSRALARYNGSLGKNIYSNQVLRLWHQEWAWQ